MAKEEKRDARPTERRQQKILEFNTEQEEEAPVRRRHLGWIVLAALVLAAGGGIFWFTYNRKTYDAYEVVTRTENTDATRMSYVAYNGSLIKYSGEGISYLDRDGTVLWIESYKMKQPKVVVSDEYVAVADINGNSVYIFNQDGKVNAMETPYTICNLDVASQGVYVVVLENETENYIELYDKFGENLVEIRTTIAESGYPMDVALSDDGTKLVTSYITTDGLTVQNTIAAYNFDDVGQNTTDRLVGGFNNLGDTIVPKVEFLDNDTVCAFGDNQFIIYSMKEKPSEKSVISGFQGEIQSIFYNSRYVGVIEKGTGESESQYQLRVFDLNGNEKFTKEFDFSYQNLYATEQEILLVGDSEARVYDFRGNLKFSYAFAGAVKNIVPTGTPRRYIVVYENATEVIKLIRAGQEEDTQSQE